MNEVVAARFEEHLQVFAKTIELVEENDVLYEMASRCVQAIAKGKKVMFCGNGGSAADAQHLAAEIVGRFQKERGAFAGLALTTDTSILTAVGNDYGFDDIFARQVEGLGQTGDVLIGLSTSGNSANVVKAMEKAREMGMNAFSFTGGTGGKLAEMCDLSFVVPSTTTARIQEMHILAGHILCELMEHDV